MIMQSEEIKNIWINGIMGLVIGDCLGMPVQFIDREEIKKNPVTTMEGYGTYNMPPGTWSDDSSMAIATLASIIDKAAIDYNDIMERFVKWDRKGEYTPFGISFDQGCTCMDAIDNYITTKDYKTCGKTGEWANGNGALMRIMPVCIYAYLEQTNGNISLKEALEYVHQATALTHNHMRAKIASGIYYFMISAVLNQKGNLQNKLQNGINEAKEFYKSEPEWNYYKRLKNLSQFAKCKENEIKSTGYVVDSLEAAIWSILNGDTFEESLIIAVNLGDDTDTIGAIAGGLAALHYSYENICKEWKDVIIKLEEIIELCRKAGEQYAG